VLIKPTTAGKAMAVYMLGEASGFKTYWVEADLDNATLGTPKPFPVSDAIDYGPVTTLASNSSTMALVRVGTQGDLKATWTRSDGTGWVIPPSYVQSTYSASAGTWSEPAAWTSGAMYGGALMSGESANGWSVVGVMQRDINTGNYEVLYQSTSPSGTTTQERLPVALTSNRILHTGMKLAISPWGEISMTWVDGNKLRARVQTITGWASPMELGEVSDITIQRPEPNVSLTRTSGGVTAIAWSGPSNELIAAVIDPQGKESARRTYLIRDRHFAPDIAELSNGRLMLAFAAANANGEFQDLQTALYTPSGGWASATALRGESAGGYWTRLFSLSTGDVALLSNHANLSYGVISAANPAATQVSTALWSHERYVAGFDRSSGRAVVFSPVNRQLKTYFLK
jgi:hypothetical protein